MLISISNEHYERCITKFEQIYIFSKLIFRTFILVNMYVAMESAVDERNKRIACKIDFVIKYFFFKF